MKIKKLSLKEILSTIMPLNNPKKTDEEKEENPYHDSEEEKEEFDELFANGDL